MTAMRIQGPSMFWPMFRMAVMGGGVMALTLFKSPEIASPVLAVCLPLVALEGWRQFLIAQRAVVIDKAAGRVMVHSRSVAGRARTTVYPLAKFRFVASYITPGRSPTNEVELISVSGGEALPLRQFSPGIGKTPFLSLSGRLQENENAAALRQSVAIHAGLQDKGFLGQRMRGAVLND